MLLGHAMESFLTIGLHEIVMNNFLQCSSFATGVFILKEKRYLGNLCWNAQNGCRLGSQVEAKLDRPSDLLTVQGWIRVGVGKEM